MANFLRKINHPIIVFAIMIFGILGIAFGVQAYLDVFQVTSSMEKTKDLDPGEGLIIKFSQPIVTKDFGNKVFLYPAKDFKLEWSDSQTLHILPREIWTPGEVYSLKISGARSQRLTKLEANYVFEVSNYPQVVDFYPSKGSQDILLDAEDPVRVSFDKSLNNYVVTFSIQPTQDLVYELDEDKKTIRLLPKTEMKRGNHYRIQTFIRHRNDNSENNILAYDTYFETKPLPPVEWEKNFEARLAQARKYTEAKISQGKYIDINLKSQILTIFENGVLLDAYLVSTGKRGMETKKGQFSICNKHPRAWSKKYGLFMPFWMALVPSGEFGIHELPEWPGGYKEGKEHLGIPVSHGCIRLGVGPAERVYNWAEIGTPVIIHD